MHAARDENPGRASHRACGLGHKERIALGVDGQGAVLLHFEPRVEALQLAQDLIPITALDGLALIPLGFLGSTPGHARCSNGIETYLGS